MLKLKNNKFLSILIVSMAANFVAGTHYERSSRPDQTNWGYPSQMGSFEPFFNVMDGKRESNAQPKKHRGQRQRHRDQQMRHLVEKQRQETPVSILLDLIHKKIADSGQLIGKLAEKLIRAEQISDAQARPTFDLIEQASNRARQIGGDIHKSRTVQAQSFVEESVLSYIFADLDRRCKWLAGCLHFEANKAYKRLQTQYNDHFDLSVFIQKINAFQGISLEADTLPELNANFKASMEAALACIAYLANPEAPQAHTIDLDLEKLLPRSSNVQRIREPKGHLSPHEFIGLITSVLYKFMQLIEAKLEHLAPLAEAKTILTLLDEIGVEVHRFSPGNKRCMIQLEIHAQNDTEALTLLDFRSQLLLGALHFAAQKAFETMEAEQSSYFDGTVFQQRVNAFQGISLEADTLPELNTNFKASMEAALACIAYLANPQATDLGGAMSS